MGRMFVPFRRYSYPNDSYLTQDPAQAEIILGQLHARNGNGNNAFGPSVSHSLSADPQSMSVDPPSNASSPSHPTAGTPGSNVGTPAFSTPIKLAPSTSAFKRSGSKTLTPQGQLQGQNQVQRGWGPKMPGVSASASAPVIGGVAPAAGGGMNSAAGTPNKGVLGQVSDLIFGW